MFSGRTDLPLERDQISRFLPWLIMFLVYLGVISLAAMLALDGVADRWRAGAAETMTIEVPTPKGERVDAARMRRLIEIVRATPGVAEAEVMPRGRVLALIEPWLGSGLGAATDGLPLPDLIDVTLDARARPDVPALQSRLRAVVSGVTVDDHGVWLAGLVNLVRLAEAIAVGLVAVVGAITVGTVVFTTRTGLSIHRDVIEVLHLTGARDSYIARQFASRAMRLALRGGIIGFALAAGTLFTLGWLAGGLEAGILPGVALRGRDWAYLAAIPIGVAFLAMLTARVTVMRTLGRML